MTDTQPFTVIIPAHNEEAVIGRCLDTILKSAPENHRARIVVAANGCSDSTVEIARTVAPDALTLDLPQGSKTMAINAANRAAIHYPRIYLDADVECDYPSLCALADALEEPGVMTVAPEIRIDLSRSSWPVRCYFRVWLKQPFAKQGKGGAGCYGLSEAALKQVGEFPPIIGDDIWIHTRFPDEQKRFVDRAPDGAPVYSLVYPPRTAREQVRVEARRQIGNAQVWAEYPSQYRIESGGTGGLAAAFRRNRNPFDVTVFLILKLLARLLARWNRLNGRGNRWTRDHTSRQAA
jgi:glycosyltransferase involved in cell wall biosynthesis